MLSALFEHELHVMSDEVMSDTAQLFDARGIARRFRHPAIFGAINTLQPGEVMRFVNDHDPLPLLAQLQQYFGDGLKAEYLQRDEEMVVIDFIFGA